MSERASSWRGGRKVFTYKVTGGTEEWKVKDFGKEKDCSSKKLQRRRAEMVSLRLKQSIKRHRASTGETEIAISRLSVMCIPEQSYFLWGNRLFSPFNSLNRFFPNRENTMGRVKTSENFFLQCLEPHLHDSSIH